MAASEVYHSCFQGNLEFGICDCQEYIPDSAERKVLACKNPEATNVGVLQKKACKGQHKCFPVNLAKFLKMPTLKNFCARFLKCG